MSTEEQPKRRGRPPKALNKRPVGRPKGEAGIMKEYRQRMLNSPKSRKVLQVIFDAALDNDHKNQAAAWKIITDRILPVGGFEKEAGGLKQNAITVNITGVDGVSIDSPPVTPKDGDDDDFIEGEVVE